MKPVEAKVEIESRSQPERTPVEEIRLGYDCPNCKSSSLKYDGLLNLVCGNCGFVQGGCFT
jgi:ribosomal protein S27AE